MRKGVNYQYYVEGEDEEKLINILKTELKCIAPGKVNKFNVIQERITTLRIRTLKQDTVVVLVFDTDVVKTDILKSNIEFLRKQSAIKEVICIPQVKNLEDELLYSCTIKKIEEITHSRSSKNWKSDWIACKNAGERLEACGFSLEKFWSRQALGVFQNIENGAKKIKL